METQKKVRLEQRMVIVLAAIFVIVLVRSVGLGVLRRRDAQARIQPTTQVNQPQATQLPILFGEHQHQLNELTEPPSSNAQTEGELVRRVVEYAATALKDPFTTVLPKATEPTQGLPEEPGPKDTQAPITPPTLVVQGIMWGQTRSLAIINEAVYTVGEMVEGAKILAIERSGVSLEYQGRSFRAMVSPIVSQ